MAWQNMRETARANFQRGKMIFTNNHEILSQWDNAQLGGFLEHYLLYFLATGMATAGCAILAGTSFITHNQGWGVGLSVLGGVTGISAAYDGICFRNVYKELRRRN